MVQEVNDVLDNKLKEIQNLLSNYKIISLNLNVSTTVIDKKFDEVLIKNKAYEKQTINGISFTLLDIRKTYEALIYDLKNKKGLIYPKKGN